MNKFLIAPAWLLAAIAYLIPSTVLFVLGVPICLYLSIMGDVEVRESTKFPGRTITTWRPKWAWLWGNEEDGVCPDYYLPTRSLWLRRFSWSAVRNSVNNLRFVWPFGFKPDSAKIKFIGDSLSDPQVAPPEGTSRWSLTWQGPYAGFLWMRNAKKLHQVWIGWKLLPKDVNGIPSTDSRSVAVSFAFDPYKSF